MNDMTNALSAISRLSGPERTGARLSALGAVLAGTANCLAPRSRILSATSTAPQTTDGDRLPISRHYRSRLG